MVHTNKKHRHPRSTAVRHKSLQRSCQAQPATGCQSAKEMTNFLQAVSTHVHHLLLSPTTWQFTNREANDESHYHARQSHSEKRCPPAKGIVNPSSQPEAQTNPDVNPTSPNGQNRRPLLRRKIV